MTARQLPTDKQLEMMASQHLSWEALCLLDSLGYIKDPYIPTRMGIGELWSYKHSHVTRRQFNHPISMHDEAIHTRVIASFLRCKAGCKRHSHGQDDVEAHHYIDGWQGLDTLESDGNWTIFNKSVAHLSLKRLELPVLSIEERKRLARETLKGLKVFISQLPQERQAWFADISDILDI